jgi:hypothetical protein
VALALPLGVKPSRSRLAGNFTYACAFCSTALPPLAPVDGTAQNRGTNDGQRHARFIELLEPFEVEAGLYNCVQCVAIRLQPFEKRRRSWSQPVLPAGKPRLM